MLPCLLDKTTRRLQFDLHFCTSFDGFLAKLTALRQGCNDNEERVNSEPTAGENGAVCRIGGSDFRAYRVDRKRRGPVGGRRHLGARREPYR
jgi:hypothetical protein